MDERMDYFVGPSMSRDTLRDHIRQAARAIELAEDLRESLECACEQVLDTLAGGGGSYGLLNLDPGEGREIRAHRALLAASLTRLARELQTTAEML